MAKADVSKIEGYENMTPEEKYKALEAYEFEDHAKDLEKAQNAISKANSEAAEYKRKLNSLLSEEEQKKQSADEEKAAMAERIAELERREKESTYKSHFLEMGYDADLALDTAKALVDGEVDRVFANQKKFLESHDKKFKADLMTGSDLSPAPGSMAGDTTTYEKLLAEAKERNDLGAVAYYTRLIQSSKQNK